MLFKNPELLYALFLLLIPIIVHLFKLRKFKQEDFTNVKFLKKVIQETRKSSRLKKWLILVTRIFLLSSIIFAFAQPYIPASNIADKESQKLVYLDNSFSMQANGESTNLLSAAIDQLISQINAGENFKLITNNEVFFNRQGQQLIQELQEIEFSDVSVSFNHLQLKAENFFKDYPQAEKDFLLISDFQENLDFPNDFDKNGINYHFMQLKPEDQQNIALDTAFITNKKPDNFELKIEISATTPINNPIAVSVYNGEQLLARNTVTGNQNSPELSFILPNQEIGNGKIELEDSGLQYDNTLYFSVNEEEPIKSVIISNTDNSFLKQIYTAPEFEVSEYTAQQIDFNALSAANFIVLNEIHDIPISLLSNLKNNLEKGAILVIIPGENIEVANYNSFLLQNGLATFQKKMQQEKLITYIAVDHPLFDDVFEENIENFEYPKTRFSYSLEQNVRPILGYMDNQPFLYQTNSIYVFTTALNSENSNFQNSPLIVPVFYQMGRNALRKSEIYHEAGKKNGRIDIPISLGKDEVLRFVKNNREVIPQQQNYVNKVEIITGDFALEAGNYQILSKNDKIGNISFNDNRNESYLGYIDLSKKEISLYNSIRHYFTKSKAASQINALWKWFVIFALLFLAIEMLLLKFLK